MKNLVIAISGTHASGKSTLLDALEQRGYRVARFSAPRAAQKDRGKNLEEMLDSGFFDMVEHQRKVLELKVKHDYEAKSQANGIVFVERSMLDVMAYATLWSSRLLLEGKAHLADHHMWYASYIEQCRVAQDTLYDAVVNLSPHDSGVPDTDELRGKARDAGTIHHLILTAAPLWSGHARKFFLCTSSDMQTRLVVAESVYRALEHSTASS